MASKERQLATLEKLEDTIQRAELQLENSYTFLATIYSQTMLVDAKDIDSGRSRRLRQEISDEVDELQDMLSGHGRSLCLAEPVPVIESRAQMHRDRYYFNLCPGNRLKMSNR